jgi:hypothetical protein
VNRDTGRFGGRRQVRVDSWLTSVLRRITDGTLLPVAYYAALDCNAAVDSRGQDGEFDLAWVRARKQLDRLWERAAVRPELRLLAEDIRREAFLAVSRASRQHEIAAYVSDDLDLIVRSRLVGLKDPFLDRLWRDYEQAESPVTYIEGPPRN